MKFRLIGNSLVPLFDADNGDNMGGGTPDNTGDGITADAGQNTNTDVNQQINNQATDTGADNHNPDAGDGSDGNQQNQTDDTSAFNNEKVEKAFAKRLAAERAKIEAEISQKTQKEFMSQYEPLIKLGEFQAARSGLPSALDWAQTVNANMQQSYEAVLQQQADEMGIDVSLLKTLIDQHPDVVNGRIAQQQISKQQKTLEEQIQHQERVKRESEEFSKAYPEIEGKDIPVEVLDLWDKGVPLLDAYNRVVLPKKISSLQQALEVKAKNQSNNKGNPGSVTGGGDVPTGFFSRDQVEKMSPADIRKNLDAIMESQKTWK